MMLVQGVVVQHSPELSREEAIRYAESEIQIWREEGLRIDQMQIEKEDDCILINAQEWSPIKRVRRITGYLSEESNFNPAKLAELGDRISHC